jgi:hypothetical protein
MTMIEPIWEQERPSASDIEQLWRELNITFETLQNPAIDELLSHLRITHINGGAEFACFRLFEHPVFHWFGSRNRLDEIDFFNRFLNLSVVAESLPALKLGESKVSNTGFEWASSFTFDGELAQTLVHGGAYNKFNGSARTAKQIGMRFCDALFGDRFLEVQMYKSDQPLTKWFHDIAWDITWLGFDKREIKVWLLCVTDTD